MSNALHTRLSFKFILIITLTTIFFSIVLSCFFVKYFSLSLRFYRETAIVSLANSLANCCEYGIAVYDDVYLVDHIIKRALLESDVIYCAFYDKQRNILSINTVSSKEKEYLLSTPIEIQENKRLSKYIKNVPNIGEFIDIYVPVVHYDAMMNNSKEEILGFVRLGVSLEKINYQINNITKKAVVLVLVFLFISIVVMSFFLFRVVLLPIKKIIVGTKKIASGCLDYRVVLYTRDEFEDLANFFNTMAANMQKQVSEMNKEKKEILYLKEAFEHRSLELEKTLKKNEDMQQSLIKNEKFATIGRLASSVAHELRNPLASIKNISYFLSKMQVFKDDKIKNMVQMLSAEVLRANKIITDLLDYSRVKKLTKMTIDIETFINKVLEIIPATEKNIKLTKKIEKFDIVLDPDKITQVIINLISNAKDAMPPSGGEIIISTKKTDSTGQIFIQDNACGMSEDTVTHIFDPLFTTKLKGIGLGLSIVKEIVELHLGKISVVSKENVGTTFTIELPLK